MLATQLQIQTREIYTCLFSPDGSRALTGSQRNQVDLWDLSNARRLQTYEHPNSVWALAWSPDGRQFLSADGSLRLWETDTAACLRTFDIPAARSLAWNFHEDLVLCAEKNSIHLADLNSGKIIRTFLGHTDGIYSLAFSPDLKRALSGSRDQTLRLWDLQTGACLRVFTGHTYHVHSIVWSNDQSRAASCSRDIRLWEIETGQCLSVFNKHTDTIRSLQSSASQQHILSAAHDATVRLWNIQTGASEIFEGHTIGLVSAAFTADQRRILSCDWKGAIHKWNL